MLQFCLSCCFFIYLSGVFIFLILSIFAITGNPALLMENYQFNSTNQVSDEEAEAVKGRTLKQYLFAAGNSAALAMTLYFLAFKKCKETDVNNNNNINTVVDNSLHGYNEPNDEIISTSKKPVELSASSPYNINSGGMSEKDSSED